MRVISKYEFRRGTNAAKTARNDNALFGEGAINEPCIFDLAAFVVESLK